MELWSAVYWKGGFLFSLAASQYSPEAQNVHREEICKPSVVSKGYWEGLFDGDICNSMIQWPGEVC